MYNGIGLSSARGSGTSGYVQTNKFHRDASRLTRREAAPTREGRDDGREARRRRPNAEILEHAAKRAIEVELAELEERLEERGVPEEARAGEIDAARARLERERAAERAKREAEATRRRDESTHAVAVRKEEEMVRLARAFGVDKRERDAREGDAFDRELQRRLRDEKRAKREEEERKREKARRKEAKRVKKEKKRAKKERKARERRERKERERAESAKRRAAEAEANARRFEIELAAVNAEIERRGLDPSKAEARVEVPPPPPASASGGRDVGARTTEVPPPPPGRARFLLGGDDIASGSSPARRRPT